MTTRPLALKIDRSICIGAESCTFAHPEAFALDDEGVATLRDGAASLTDDERRAAALECPSGAIVLQDASGNAVDSS